MYIVLPEPCFIQKMRIIPIRFFDDNYAYAIYVDGGSSYVLVDPADWGSVGG
jgi:hypothetical protein